MAIVIGKPGKFFSAAQAVDHIGGYLVFNDITARDIQRREMKSGATRRRSTAQATSSPPAR